MGFIQNISIKNKIILIVFFISTFILSIGFAIVIWGNISKVKGDLIKNTKIEAKIAGDYCVTALDFGYPDKAKENLEKLKNVPNIENAVVYDENDSVFATYNKEIYDVIYPTAKREAFHEFESQFLHLFEPIIYNDKYYGTIYIRIKTTIEEEIRANLRIMVYLIAGLLLFALLLTFWMQKIISSPILKLADATERITRAGDYSIRVKKQGNDEIGILYDEFNKMLDQLNIRAQERDKAEQQLKDSELRYRRLSENAKDMIFRVTIPDFKFEYVSPAVEEITGYKPEDLYADYKIFNQVVHPDWIDYFVNQLNKLKKGQSTHNIEFQIIHKNNQTRWVYQRNVIVKDEQGRPVAVEGMITDITERKKYEHDIMKLNVHLEKRVKQRTLELEKAYVELKDFAYITSHDLKTPLRGISQPAHWLWEDYRHCFDDNARELMDLILGRVRRMENLIEGILKYLKFGTFVDKFEVVDVKALILNIISQTDIPDNIKVNIGNDMPVINSDRQRIEQIFASLVENAVTFMDKENGIIDIECKELEQDWQFAVKDNGPGIAEKYFDKIFGIFQTLANKEENPNIGIGLPIAKKITEQLGGAIWLDSVVGEGSTFYFTIKKTKV